MRVIVLTTDLPFFPGKNGHDFFNIRYLAQRHDVGVVAPHSAWMPAAGVENLEKASTKVYLWPRPAPATPLFVSEVYERALAPWIKRLPPPTRRRWLNRLLGISRQPADAFEKLAILSNCAPHLLHALRDGFCQAVLLIQSSAAPWLDYLPAGPAKLVYFHDVRSDYLRRAGFLANGAGPDGRELRLVRRQESEACRKADGVGFVSELDLERAKALEARWRLARVAPIPIDTEYYSSRPRDWPEPARPMVLFTGHLSHPPNVDAVLYFLKEIWPGIRRSAPEAVFQVAGLLPAPALAAAVEAAEQAELFPNVPDIRPFFWNARAYVVPMRYGGGVRQKIMEAWAMEVPVVCTPMAAEGLEAASNTNCFMESDPAGFAGRVVDLLKKPAPPVLLSSARRRVVETNAIPVAASRFEGWIAESAKIKSGDPFKVLVDLRWMELGVAGGAEQSMHELFSALGRLDRVNSYRMYCPRRTYCEWSFPRGFRVRGRFSDQLYRDWEKTLSAAANGLAASLGMPRVLSPEMRTLSRIRRLDFDFVHSTIGYIHPDLAAFPHVLTVHDLQHLSYPNFFGPADWATREQLYRDSARQAKHIICISEFTRQEVHRHYGIPLERMTTVWNIPSGDIWKTVPEGRRRRLLAGLGLEGRFLYFPAHCWPHKNHAGLVEAFELALPSLPSDLLLVFSGRPFPESHPAAGRIKSRGLEGRIVHLGYRSPFEVHALYASAHALVFPSLFEGFGMPLVEAMAAGCPVACSGGSSLPEVGGEAALYFDPENADSVAQAIVRISSEDRLRDNLRENGRRRLPLFDSRLAALKTLAVYREVFDQLW